MTDRTDSDRAPIRGRRGRDRRIAEKVAADFAARHAPPRDDEVARLRHRRGRRRGRGCPRGGGREAPPGRAPRVGRHGPPIARGPGPVIASRTCPPCRRCSRRPGPSPPFASDWAHPPTSTDRVCVATPVSWPSRTAPRRTWRRPSPWTSRSSGSPAMPRSATGSPRSSARGSVTRRRVAEPRAADRARLRAERARRRRDGRPCRGPGRLAGRQGPGPRGERAGAAPAHDRAGRPAGPTPRADASGRGSTRTRCCASCSTSAMPRSPRSPAGASSRVAAASSTSSRRRATCRSGSSSSATRSTRCGPSTRPTSARPARSMACRAPPGVGVPAPDRRAWPRSASGSARPPVASASGSQRTSPGSRARPTDPLRPATERRLAGPRRRRRRGGLGGAPGTGDRPRPRRARHPARPRRARRHRRGGRVPVAPGRRAAWRADRGRGAAEGLAVDVPPAARLEGPARRLADARADLGVGAAGGCRDGRRSALHRVTSSAGASRRCRSGRAGRLGDAVAAWQEDGARIVLASDQAPRLAEVLAEADHPVAVTDGPTEAPPPGAIALVGRSLNGGFTGGPDGLTFVTDRELFGTVRVRRPKALRRVVPRDILERLDARRPRRPHRPRRRALRADAPARRRRATSATTWSCRSRPATGSSCRSSRSPGSRATPAPSART